MRGATYLVLGDIHANYQALAAVVEALEGLGIDRTVFLGDLVGYGPQPEKVVRLVREWPDAIFVRGNHDAVISESKIALGWSRAAKQIADWTREQLSEESLEFLKELPTGPIEIEEGIWACHGAPHDEDHYLVEGERDTAFRSTQCYQGDTMFFAHTHVPYWFRVQHQPKQVNAGHPMDGNWSWRLKEKGERGGRYTWLISPGSVGQPRDGDNRAGFGVYDSASRVMQWRRCEYDIAGANQAVMAASGLPNAIRYGIVRRLSVGA